MKKNPVVHFEMPAGDNNRVKEFYEKAFGWEMQQLGAEMGNYILAGTTDVDDNRMPKAPGAINGGFFKKGEYGNIPHIVIAVDNLDEHINIVKNAGGKIDGDIMDIAGIGKFVMIRDTEDNRVGILEPKKM